MNKKDGATMAWLGAELLLFLGGVPALVVAWKNWELRHLLLIGAGGYAAWRLHGKVAWRELFGAPPSGWWRGPAVRGAIVAVASLVYVSIVAPESLFVLPRSRPGVWALLFVAYPLLSVLPQELIYRVYVFETFAPLWGRPLAPVLCSAFLFGWLHVVFAGWFAMLATAAAGMALALVYRARRTDPGVIWALCLEHSLYGLAVFTVGLGSHFYVAR